MAAAEVEAEAAAAMAAAAEAAAAISAEEADDDEKETSTTTAQQAALTAQILVLQRMVAALMEEKTARAGEEAHNVSVQAESAIQQSGISLESIREAEEQTRATEGGVQLSRGAALGDETATAIDEQLRQAQAQMQQVQARTAALQRQQAVLRSATHSNAVPSTPLAVPIAHRSHLHGTSAAGPLSPPRGGVGGGGGGGINRTSLAHLQQASAASLARVNPLRQHAKRLQPSELLGREAARGSVLEDWLFQIERSVGDDEQYSLADILGFARTYWDRSVNTWWTGYTEMQQANGTPVQSWEGVKAAMRANYTAASDEQTACDQLYSLSMRSTETMDEYVARVSELYNRIPRARVGTEAAAEHMQRGVKPTRFPLAMVEVTTRQQRERVANAGKGLGFEVMRGMLIEAAVREPTHLIAAAAAAAAAAAPQQHNHRPGQTSNRSRINNVSTGRGRYPLPDEDEEDRAQEGGGQDEQQHLHAVNTSDMKCYRCGQVGHLSRDCKKAETRTCHTCKKVGHLANRCPSKSGGGTGGSKNE